MRDAIFRAEAEAWELTAIQHGVVARRQLLALGFTPKAIAHRLATGRLHAVFPGVYAVGRPGLSQHGRWMAAVLACGDHAALSHRSAGDHMRISGSWHGRIDITVPPDVRRRHAGLTVHRHALIEIRVPLGIPTASPLDTLIGLAQVLDRAGCERAVNEAHNLDLIAWDELAGCVAGLSPNVPGVARLRRIVGRASFRLTDSELERLFLPVAARAGLPPPDTQAWVLGFRADFWWPALRLAVETDSLRFHRTPLQQARDRLRDQTWTAAGMTVLRFTHWQVAHERAHVVGTLKAVFARLRGTSHPR